MKNLNIPTNIDALKISIASPMDIKEWSYGEVTKPETINYRTGKSEKHGLFCERIFGPERNWECSCGKYRSQRFAGVICDKCGVEVTSASVRRERMGHISLAAPVVHIWFFKNVPSKLAAYLGITPKNLENIIYFSSHVIVDIDYEAKDAVIAEIENTLSSVDVVVSEEITQKIEQINTDLADAIDNLDLDDSSTREKKIAKLTAKANKKIKDLEESLSFEVEKRSIETKSLIKNIKELKYLTVVPDATYIELEEYMDQFCEVSIGADSIKRLLEEFDIDQEMNSLRGELETAKSLKAKKIKSRLKLLETINRSGVDAKSMIITELPVIPPDIRPMVALDGGRYATDDSNDLYRRIINRNNRLKKLLGLNAPDVIVRNEKRMLQEAVDSLIDSSKARKVRTRQRKEYKSLADKIKGKSGYLRANLLGKRVDYSARSVIISGPDLKFQECGIPRDMALELFKPYIIKLVMERGYAPNMKSAKYFIESKSEEVYDMLEEVTKDRPVILNRAPTLHRLSIQAFYIKLVSGKAIQLHPIVTEGFNADFDGDQMAVHLPITQEAIKEAKELLMSGNNILKPSNGSVVASPSKDMLLGLYYLTSINEQIAEHKNIFINTDEVRVALNNGLIKIRQRIKLKYNNETIVSTAGRVVFNSYLPDNFDFHNDIITNSDVTDFVLKALKENGQEETTRLIDVVKLLGFEYATKSGISLSIFDIHKPQDLEEKIEEANSKISQLEENYGFGLSTLQEKNDQSIATWASIVAHFNENILAEYEEESPVKLSMNAKASKASPAILVQISAIKGNVADPHGKIFNFPILGNYTDGLSSFGFFLTNRGVRRTYMDKGIGTADSGYLSRRLVNVAQNVLVRSHDCGTEEYIEIKKGENTVLTNWVDRCFSRTVAADIKNSDGEILVEKGQILNRQMIDEIKASDVESISLYSPITCNTRFGVCQKCYGANLANGEKVEMGLAVGIIAAQSIGEPGTQLVLRTFHTGGVVKANITTGLPRIEELLEARNPKNSAIISEVAGKVSVSEKDGYTQVLVKTNDKDSKEVIYDIPIDADVIVDEGDLIAEGTALTAGSLPLQSLFELKGEKAAKHYLISEILDTYASQGVEVNDKHLELIVGQMFNKVRVIDSKDSDYVDGDIVSADMLYLENKKLEENGSEPVTFKPLMMGITKSSRIADSWLDAASFEQTSSVLTESAVSAKVDNLIGLKENVIIGKRIPTGEATKIEI